MCTCTGMQGRERLECMQTAAPGTPEVRPIQERGAAVVRRSLHRMQRVLWRSPGGRRRRQPASQHLAGILQPLEGHGVAHASMGAATAEQQALEHVCFARVLRLCCRSKGAGGVGSHARAAVVQLGGRAQPMQHVHHLRRRGCRVGSSAGKAAGRERVDAS